ncbi:hypothetical protein PV08_03647 [Exophiala spinifera]|uniref:Uncharacterized protein n=1 Tax=Exophiala spinifera TaxID=91928 RepID=A0A0D2A363_9EURO|nr:uncharacterized protein PV08_03647 [Exophiala spinifera]KIW19352.1 hypothetical protein PV08_03647 [Exophiala spinifera]
MLADLCGHFEAEIITPAYHQRKGEQPRLANEAGPGKEGQDVSRPTKDGDEGEGGIPAVPPERDVHTSSPGTNVDVSQLGMGSGPVAEELFTERKAVEEKGLEIEEMCPAASASSVKTQSINKGWTLAEPALALTDREARQDKTKTQTSDPLDVTWRQLNSLVDSYTGALITASDVRRDTLTKRERVIEQLEALISSSDARVPTDLQKALLDLQAVERKLEDEDEDLIQQGYQIVSQGSRIFGPAAEDSLEFLRQQDIVVQSPHGEDGEEGSEISQNDIRRDESMDARLFLSKKGDVDLLLESLMELEEEEFLAADGAGFETDEPAILETLQTRKRELIQRLDEAEEELLRLWQKLPDRQVSIPDDQLRSSVDEEMPGSEIWNPDNEDVSEVNENSEDSNHLIPSGQKQGYRQILNYVTNNISTRPNILVDAYLLYQLRQLPEEQAAYVEAIKGVVKGTLIQRRTDLKHFMLSDWFEDVPNSKSTPQHSKSARRWTSSPNKTSLAMHSNQTQVTHGQSEPLMPRNSSRHRAGPGAEYPTPGPWKLILNGRTSLG